MNGFLKSGLTLALTLCACGTAYAHAHLLQSAPAADAVVTLGFKNAKNLEAIEVTNEYPGGHWENQGYDWFAEV